MAELAPVLQFIATIEQKHSHQSIYEIANILRGYTKPSYTTQVWTIATGYEQSFIDGTLNQEVILAGEVTDFGHFIASLSDQMNQPGLQWSDFTRWTSDHTSWAGDIGSAIALFRSQPDQFQSLAEAFDRFASDSDYVADVAASVVGAMLNSNAQLSISSAIQQYNAAPYSDHVKTFLRNEFSGQIEANQIKNPAKIEADIRNAAFAYLELSPDSSLLKAAKKIFSPKLRSQAENKANMSGADLLQGSLHFLTHLVQKGNLQPLKFKPYQYPQAAWLGTVNYEVSVPN
jgi:hypothetical protein